MFKNKKSLARALIAVGCFALVTSILLTLSIGGPAALVALLISVFLNALGVTFLRH